MGNEGASSCEERSDVVNLQSLRGIANYLSISKAKLALVGLGFSRISFVALSTLENPWRVHVPHRS